MEKKVKPDNARTPELEKLLDKHERLTKEEHELKDKDPEKSAQKRWDAFQVSKEIEKTRE
ncbi:MAG: hypothetical protein CL868_03665 [Cytophagaceae bacterium]|nr:hypothetical protein [Cytophagaceae bacterium]